MKTQLKTRIRQDLKANYRAIFYNGKTNRMKIDPLKSIITPSTTEIEDVAINNKCLANCSYCYTSALKNGNNFSNIIDKAIEVYCVPENKRPFQIAIGGAGEATLHPDFNEFCKTVRSLNIIPNYTTNGMHLNDDILSVTEQYCGGVAVSYHPHIEKIYHRSIQQLSEIDTQLNTHLIIGDKQSLIDAQAVYQLYYNEIDYFVLLPYQTVGRAKQIEVESTWRLLFEWLEGLLKQEQNKFAFGALFYNYLNNNDINLNINVYEPEMYSGYRMFDDSYKLIRKSSYDLKPKYNEK